MESHKPQISCVRLKFLLLSLSLMENDTRVLFCLIEGDTDAFDVTVPTYKSISSLKKVIWDECKNTFRDVDARYLVLWKVSHFRRNYPVCS